MRGDPRPAQVDDDGEDVEWQDLAACSGEDPDDWFPEARDQITAARAKAICDVCPVSGDCLEYAIRTRQKHGIWGGLTDKERRREVRQRRAAGAPVNLAAIRRRREPDRG